MLYGLTSGQYHLHLQPGPRAHMDMSVLVHQIDAGAPRTWTNRLLVPEQALLVDWWNESLVLSKSNISRRTI